MNDFSAFSCPFRIVAVIACVTALCRFLPFFVFSKNRSVPAFIRYLGSVLPYAMIAMLVVYCLKDISFAAPALFLPALIAVCVVILLHVWKRNTLLSIIGGTACYMLLIRFFP